jgi:UDP-N-acetylmuramate dehydrogenase
MSALRRGHDWESRVLRNEPMSKHTSWRVGGPADVYFVPHDVNELSAFLSELDPQTPITWVGLGSNMLVRDGGIRGAVISVLGALGRIERVGETGVLVEAGVACAKIARMCSRWHLGPAEFFAGIPGTMGGALSMNAGAFGGETWQRVQRVQMINRRGELAWRSPDEFQVGYRSVKGPVESEWFIAAQFDFLPQTAAAEEKIRAMLSRRKDTQPIGQPSCGSVFRNPEGDHAARLIEAAGLKGLVHGGAQVSDKHANFIINAGGATAAQIEYLIDHVQRTVEQRFGVHLVHEVRMVGEPG